MIAGGGQGKQAATGIIWARTGRRPNEDPYEADADVRAGSPQDRLLVRQPGFLTPSSVARANTGYSDQVMYLGVFR